MARMRQPPVGPDGMPAPPPSPPAAYTARLLIGCADRPGIVAAVSGFLFEQGANIVSSQQYSTDPTGGRFFLRTEFFLPSLTTARHCLRRRVARGPFEALRERLQERFAAEVAARFAMDWQIRWWGAAPAHRDPRLAPRPLPARPAVALAPRRARRGDRRR